MVSTNGEPLSSRVFTCFYRRSSEFALNDAAENAYRPFSFTRWTRSQALPGMLRLRGHISAGICPKRTTRTGFFHIAFRSAFPKAPTRINFCYKFSICAGKNVQRKIMLRCNIFVNLKYGFHLNPVFGEKSNNEGKRFYDKRRKNRRNPSRCPNRPRRLSKGNLSKAWRFLVDGRWGQCDKFPLGHILPRIVGRSARRL